MHNLPSEEVQRLLKQVVDHFDKEDRSVRERQIRTWRRLKLFWEGFQKAWYSEVAHDWRIWDEAKGDDSEQSYYDKPINVFRAYLESIIAALSVTVPPIKCFPDDADNTLDLSTARAGDKIAQLIYRHNEVSLLWLHALFIYCTEGMVACYSYSKADNKYGTYQENKYDDISEQHEIVSCPECGFQIEDKVVSESRDIAEDLQDEFQPDNVEIQDYINAEQDLCPSCMMMIAPEIKKESFIVTRLIGVTNLPKTRMCLEVYGGLYVKIPNYVKKQEDCPYLIFSYEIHYANVVERYEHLHNKKFAEKIRGSAGPKDPYEEWGRLSPQYQGEYPLNIVTVRNAWLRPCAFNVLDKEESDELKKLYPNGAVVVLINDEFAEARNEAFDDSWTLTHNPLSDFIHHDPLGLLLVSVQEITNDLISLVLQTIEHGIAQTFADPAVLNFNAYRQMETIPGGVYEAIPKSGKSLSDAFYQVKTSTLSQEIMPFSTQIQELAQLVSGALPSLFGGAIEGSETASQYSMSRAQALQRLQNTWKMFNIWWKQIFGKVIPMFIKEVKDDERDVQRDKDGNFINVFIRKAELEGKLGKIELESSDALPLTWSQQKDIIMQLLNAGNPEILQIIGSPENLPIIREAIGLTDFYVPGEDDRNKQYDEIKALLNSEPMQTGDELMPEMPSVDIDPIYDNHAIEFEICRKWIVSEAGRQAKIDNEAGYRNVLLHGKLHYMMMNPDFQQSQGAIPVEEPNPLEMQEAPITGEEDVSTIQ